MPSRIVLACWILLAAVATAASQEVADRPEPQVIELTVSPAGEPAPISPLALEIVQRMDRLFEVERSINGQSSPERLTIRRDLSAPLVDELEALMLKLTRIDAAAREPLPRSASRDPHGVTT